MLCISESHNQGLKIKLQNGICDSNDVIREMDYQVNMPSFRKVVQNPQDHRSQRMCDHLNQEAEMPSLIEKSRLELS